jgi:hypothetical protein
MLTFMRKHFKLIKNFKFCVGCASVLRRFCVGSASVRWILCVGSASVFASVRRFCVGFCVGKKIPERENRSKGLNGELRGVRVVNRFQIMKKTHL